MPTFDASRAEILIYTYKAGLLAKLAHDLKLRVTDFELTIGLPGGEEEAPTEVDEIERIELRVNPRSLRVVCALRKGREDYDALSADDIRKVEENIIEDVLEPGRFAGLAFDATEITTIRAGQRYRMRGELLLHGTQRRVDISAELRGGTWVAETTLHQPDFGITPFSALLGSLKIKPETRVVVKVPAGLSG